MVVWGRFPKEELDPLAMVPRNRKETFFPQPCKELFENEGTHVWRGLSLSDLHLPFALPGAPKAEAKERRQRSRRRGVLAQLPELREKEWNAQRQKGFCFRG